MWRRRPSCPEPCAGLRVHAALPSRSQAAGRALARLQSCASSPGSYLASAFASVGLVGVVSVRSVRVALVSRVCLRTSQSTFVLTFPKLHMYALL